MEMCLAQDCSVALRVQGKSFEDLDLCQCFYGWYYTSSVSLPTQLLRKHTETGAKIFILSDFVTQNHFRVPLKS